MRTTATLNSAGKSAKKQKLGKRQKLKNPINRTSNNNQSSSTKPEISLHRLKPENQSSSTKPKNQPAAPVAKPEREKGQDKQEYRREVKDWRKEKRMAGDKLKNEVKSGNNNPLNPVDTSNGPRGPVAPGRPQPGTGFVKPENVPGVPQGNKPAGPVPGKPQPATGFVKPEECTRSPSRWMDRQDQLLQEDQNQVQVLLTRQMYQECLKVDQRTNSYHLPSPTGPTQNMLTDDERAQYSSYLNQNKDVAAWYNDAKGEGMAGGQGGYNAAYGTDTSGWEKNWLKRNE